VIVIIKVLIYLLFNIGWQENLDKDGVKNRTDFPDNTNVAVDIDANFVPF
jgi:hypothetical protein